MAVPLLSLSADRLEQKLADAKPVYTSGEAVAEANRCLYCHDAPCVTACPTGIDIPGRIVDHVLRVGELEAVPA